jgi:uncharacterized protein
MRWLILILTFWAAPLLSEGWPDWQRTTVTDMADLMDPATEARVVAQLDALKARTGIEFAVLTLDRQADWQPDLTLEQFATALFNRWGIGNASRNDGILVMVLREDRAMRIELGAGYDRYWDRTAETVVDDHFLPDFRRDNFAAGIEKGVAETIRAIAEPFAAKAPPPDDAPDVWWLMMMAGMLAFILRRWLGDRIRAWQRCPQCGHRGLRIQRRTITAASRSGAGTGERTTTCPNCDWTGRDSFVIPRRSSSSGGFGGGRSGGGGASGRF